MAGQALNIQVLKEVNSKNGEPVAAPPRGPKRGCGGPLLVRQACRHLGLARSSLAYRRKPPGERRVQTEAAIMELSRKHPRYGYRRVHASFNDRFRDECLNRERLESALEAQVIARAFRDEYNDIRPHGSLDYRSPSELRAELLKQAPSSGQARQAGPSLRPQLASTDNTHP